MTDNGKSNTQQLNYWRLAGLFKLVLKYGVTANSLN